MTGTCPFCCPEKGRTGHPLYRGVLVPFPEPGLGVSVPHRTIQIQGSCLRIRPRSIRACAARRNALSSPFRSASEMFASAKRCRHKVLFDARDRRRDEFGSPAGSPPARQRVLQQLKRVIPRVPLAGPAGPVGAAPYAQASPVRVTSIGANSSRFAGVRSRAFRNSTVNDEVRPASRPRRAGSRCPSAIRGWRCRSCASCRCRCDVPRPARCRGWSARAPRAAPAARVPRPSCRRSAGA